MPKFIFIDFKMQDFYRKILNFQIDLFFIAAMISIHFIVHKLLYGVVMTFALVVYIFVFMHNVFCCAAGTVFVTGVNKYKKSKIICCLSKKDYAQVLSMLDGDATCMSGYSRNQIVWKAFEYDPPDWILVRLLKFFEGIELNEFIQYPSESTILRRAVQEQRYHLVEYLLKTLSADTLSRCVKSDDDQGLGRDIWDFSLHEGVSRLDPRYNHYGVFMLLLNCDKLPLPQFIEVDNKEYLMPHYAVQTRDNLLTDLIIRHPRVDNLNEYDDAGYTPLHRACARGNYTAVRALLDRHVSCDIRSQDRKGILYYLINNADGDYFDNKNRYDIAALCLPYIQDRTDWESRFIDALEKGCVGIIILMLSHHFPDDGCSRFVGLIRDIIEEDDESTEKDIIENLLAILYLDVRNPRLIAILFGKRALFITESVRMLAERIGDSDEEVLEKVRFPESERAALSDLLAIPYIDQMVDNTNVLGDAEVKFLLHDQNILLNSEIYMTDRARFVNMVLPYASAENINAVDTSGETPLYKAMESNAVGVFDILMASPLLDVIQESASELCADYKFTPLEWAVIFGRENMFAALAARQGTTCLTVDQIDKILAWFMWYHRSFQLLSKSDNFKERCKLFDKVLRKDVHDSDSSEIRTWTINNALGWLDWTLSSTTWSGT